MNSDSASTQARLVRCPSCGGDSIYSQKNPWRPFCSKRCRQIDLGAWASEAFRVEANPEPQEPDDQLDGSRARP